VDTEGQAHVLGNIPVPGQGGAWDMFMAKLSADGSHLLYSVQLGGSSFDIPRGLALDSAGNALVYGETSSTDFPVRNALQPQLNVTGDLPYDAFLTRLDPAGALLDSTYFGGSSEETATALAVDPAGFIYLLGESASPDFPLRDPLPIDELPIPTLYQRMGHVTRLDPRAAEVLFSTFLDGTERERGWAYGMTLDTAGNVYVVGASNDPEFPVVGPSPRTQAESNYDAFAVKIDLGPGRAPDCSAATAAPTMIRPPDGRMVPVALGGVTDPDGDPVSVAVTAVFQDEPLSKKEQPDATGLGTAEPRVRASRAGVGDGRVYHLTFTATDPRGASCTGAVAVCVSHDQGKRSTCGDGGRLVDSAGGR
jgi:Beta-propeller repeat